MKTLLNGLLISTVMMGLMVGCGKDASKSSGGSSATSLYTGSVPQNSQAAFNNLKSWYSSSTEGQPSNPGVYTEYRQVQTTSTNSGCKDLFGSPYIDFNVCLSGSLTGSGTSTTRSVFVVAGQVKSSNTNLAAVFAPPAGYELMNVTQSSSIFTIQYGNRTTGYVLSYKVDTSVNSAFNPVEIQNTSTGRNEYLVNIR